MCYGLGGRGRGKGAEASEESGRFTEPVGMPETSISMSSLRTHVVDIGRWT